MAGPDGAHPDAKHARPAWASGPRAYGIALVAGLPIVLAMIGFAARSLRNGDAPDGIVALMGLPAAVGVALAGVGMRSRPQRFRGPALLLTLAPAALAGVIFLGWVFLVVMFATGGES